MNSSKKKCIAKESLFKVTFLFCPEEKLSAIYFCSLNPYLLAPLDASDCTIYQQMLLLKARKAVTHHPFE